MGIAVIVFLPYIGFSLFPLAILGSMGGSESDVFHAESYFGDLRDRPNKEDMRTVADFVDDIMKELEKEQGQKL